MSDIAEMVKRAVDRFLAWPLPKTFEPDCGVSFDRGPGGPLSWPLGTNLFTANEARAMFEYCVGSEIEQQAREIADEAQSRELLAKRLEEVCIALKGPNPPNGLRSWHDLGPLTAALKVRAERAEAELAKVIALAEGFMSESNHALFIAAIDAARAKGEE
jgi:hypothetical protein